MSKNIIRAVFFIALFGICSNAQKINIVVADSCGFVVKGRTVGLTASAVANTNTTIANVSFSVDGGTITSPPLTVPPYTVSWDSTSVPNGCHTIAASATDSNGNTGLNSVTVSVKN